MGETFCCLELLYTYTYVYMHVLTNIPQFMLVHIGFFVQNCIPSAPRDLQPRLTVRRSLYLMHTSMMLSLELSPSSSRKRKHTTHSDDVRATVVRLRDSGASWKRVVELSGV